MTTSSYYEYEYSLSTTFSSSNIISSARMAPQCRRELVDSERGREREGSDDLYRNDTVKSAAAVRHGQWIRIDGQHLDLTGKITAPPHCLRGIEAELDKPATTTAEHHQHKRL